jgi:hypothetical protein
MLQAGRPEQQDASGSEAGTAGCFRLGGRNSRMLEVVRPEQWAALMERSQNSEIIQSGKSSQLCAVQLNCLFELVLTVDNSYSFAV